MFQVWTTNSIIDPQFYGIPLGLTLIAIAEFYRHELTAKSSTILRISGLLCIYLSSAIQILFRFNDPKYYIILGALALFGIIGGLILNKTIYIYLATAFLLADVLGYFVKYGLEHGILEGILMVITGASVLGVALYFRLKRHIQEKNE